MHKPRWFIICIIMPFPEKPVTFTFFIFHYIIISVQPGIQPPFSFYAFAGICFLHFMQPVFIPEIHWRIIGYGCRNFYALRFMQKLYGAQFIIAPLSCRLIF